MAAATGSSSSFDSESSFGSAHEGSSHSPWFFPSGSEVHTERTPTHTGGLSAAVAAVRSSDEHAGGAHGRLTLDTSVGIKRPLQGAGPTTNPKRINLNGSDADSISLVPSCGGAASSPDALPPPTMIFLKVDSGAYCDAPLTWDEMKDLRALGFLEVLRGRDTDLSGLNARSSTVTIVQNITPGGRVPTATDEMDAVLVDGPVTIGHLAARRTTGDVLFIHVRTQPPAAAGAGAASVTAAAMAAAMAAAAASATCPSVASLPVLSSKHNVSRAVDAIRRGLVTQTEVGDLQLPSGTWPAATNNTLFVRSFYDALYTNVLRECKMKQSSGVTDDDRRIITGQPGIGKSVFGWYMIYRLLLSPHKRTIIYAAKKEGKTYVIKPDEPARHKASVECLSELSVMSDLGPDPVIIADSFVPPVLPYPTFVLSSPGVLFKEGMRDTLNEYHDAYLYMPIYSEEELIHLWRRAFSGLDEEGVRRRLNLWGPIPRHVLVKHEPKKQSALVNASLAIPLEKIIAVARGQYMSAAGGRGEELDVPHRIVHERAAGQDAKPGSKAADPRNEEFYQRGVVITSSAAFARHLTEQMIGCQNWNAAFLVDTTARIGALGGLRGCRFEEIAIDLLLLGGTFKVRNLTTNVETTLKLPASDRVEWADVAQLPELKDTRGTLVPTIRNAAGLDALIWSEKGCYMPLDCTVSPEHGFHAEGVSNAVRALGWKQEHGWPCMKALRRTIVQKRIVYCWVVPQDQFDSSWWSPKVAKPGTDATKEAQEVVAHMTQFALCIPRLTSLKALSELFASNAVPKPTELVSEG